MHQSDNYHLQETRRFHFSDICSCSLRETHVNQRLQRCFNETLANIISVVDSISTDRVLQPAFLMT